MSRFPLPVVNVPLLHIGGYSRFCTSVVIPASRFLLLMLRITPS